MARFEITDTKGMTRKEAERAISNNYHDNLSYKDIEFFDTLYMGTIDKAASSVIEEANREGGQESYLGYLPEQDVFVSGWDTWDGGQNVVFLKVDADGESTVLDDWDTDLLDGFMYDSGGSYSILHGRYPQLVDIRLD